MFEQAHFKQPPAIAGGDAKSPGFHRDAKYQHPVMNEPSPLDDVGMQVSGLNEQRKQTPTRLTSYGAQRRGLRWTVGIGLSPNPHTIS
jgi:hypothetical protein